MISNYRGNVLGNSNIDMSLLNLFIIFHVRHMVPDYVGTIVLETIKIN